MRFSVVAAGSVQGLEPADAETTAFLGALQVGGMVELQKPGEHGSPFRRFVYAMLGRMKGFAPHCSVRNFLAIRTGHVDIVRQGKGLPLIVPRSISDMPAAEFETFWDDAKKIILESMLLPPGEDASSDALRAEIEGYRS